MKRTGSLPRYGLLDLLRAARSERFTGFGDVESSDEQVRLYLVEGEVVFARSSALRHSLPAYLLSQQLVGRHQLKELLEAARRDHVKLEALLTERGAITADALQMAQQALARYVLSFAFGLQPGSFALLPTEPPRFRAPFRLDVEAAFFRFVATRDTPEEEASLLRDCFGLGIARCERYSLWGPTAHGVFAGEPDARDPILAALEEGSQTVSSLLEAGHDAFDVIRRVFALHRAGLIRFLTPEADSAWREVEGELFAASEPRGAARPQGADAPALAAESASEAASVAPLPHVAAEASGRVEPSNVAPLVRPGAAPPAPTPHPAQQHLIDTWEALSAAELYEVLELAPDAPLSAVRHQFRTRRLRYDPSAFAQVPLSEQARVSLERIAERLELAYRTLTDFERRSAYHVSQSIDPRALRVSLRALFEAEALLGEALEHLREGRHPEATAALREATALSPFDASLKAELAWAIFVGASRGVGSTDARGTVAALLREARELDPRNEAVLRVRARVARMEGRMREALEGYQRLLAVHPYCREAARSVTEIRSLINRPATHAAEGAPLPEAEEPIEVAEAMDADFDPSATSPAAAAPAEPDAEERTDGGVVHRITGLFRRR